jgi:hypothetical protein
MNVEGRLAAVDARHVHQGVDTAELGDDAGHGVLNGRAARHVAHDGNHRVIRRPHFPRRLVERGLFAPGDDHLRLALGEPRRNRAANAAARAGNEDHLVGDGKQRIGHGTTFWGVERCVARESISPWQREPV